MDDVLDDLVRAARSCERAARQMETAALLDIRTRLVNAIEQIERAWSGSWIGYQARVYTKRLQPRRPGESFDSGWGMTGSEFVNTTRGEWAEYDHRAVMDHVSKLAEVSGGDWKRIESVAADAAAIFGAVKAEILPTLDAVLAAHDDEAIRKARAEIAKLESHHSMRDLARVMAPGQIVSRDTRAMNEGIQVPPHLQVQARLVEQFSYGSQLADLAKQIRYVSTYLQKRHKMTGKSVARTDGKIFIGHGRSAVWRDLKDFIQDRLRLQWDEFTREPTAGKSTKERLEEMLDASSFAFLVMTAEDETVDGKMQARANVIHEVGLFQGRLGFERAIVLLEEGCEEFANIIGISQIRFPKGDVTAKFEEIRRVLERENIIRS